MEPLALRIEEIDDDRIPEGMVCMGSFLQSRLIARSAVTPEMLTDIENRAVFAAPVRIALAAVEQHPGLQCRLFALLPAAQFHETEPEEPWAASVPQFQAPEPSEEGQTVIPLLLGQIVRFSRDRKHPDDLPAEAADILQTILADDKPMTNVVDKLLDDLLDS